jgi:hypothetical protein
MIGSPKELKTKQDYLNAVDYAVTTGSGKTALKNRLVGLKENSKILVLKSASRKKTPEEQTGDDFVEAENPACEKIRLGLSDQEIDEMIGALA